MLKSASNASLWAEMSEAQKIKSVSTGSATLKEMVEGLLDGPVKLRETCRDFLANSDVCLQIQPPNKIDRKELDLPELHQDHDDESSAEEIAAAAHSAVIDNARKRRQGLPEGYVARVHKH